MDKGGRLERIRRAGEWWRGATIALFVAAKRSAPLLLGGVVLYIVQTLTFQGAAFAVAGLVAAAAIVVAIRRPGPDDEEE